MKNFFLMLLTATLGLAVPVTAQQLNISDFKIGDTLVVYTGDHPTDFVYQGENNMIKRPKHKLYGWSSISFLTLSKDSNDSSLQSVNGLYARLRTRTYGEHESSTWKIDSIKHRPMCKTTYQTLPASGSMFAKYPESVGVKLVTCDSMKVTINSSYPQVNLEFNVPKNGILLRVYFGESVSILNQQSVTWIELIYKNPNGEEVRLMK